MQYMKSETFAMLKYTETKISIKNSFIEFNINLFPGQIVQVIKSFEGKSRESLTIRKYFGNAKVFGAMLSKVFIAFMVLQGNDKLKFHLGSHRSI